jgi:hypothetical protein
MTVPPTDNSETNKEISSAVLSGTSLGRCLKMALDQVVSSTDNDDDDDDDNDDPSATSSLIRLDKQAVDNIFNAFGSAAADTLVAASLEEETPSVTAATPPPHPAPRVLLQGRCKHYNRFGRYWSISIEDVKMKQRPTKFIQKRRGRRASIWDRDEEIVFDTTDQEGGAATTADKQRQSNNTRQNVVSIDETIELMAYGDG